MEDKLVELIAKYFEKLNPNSNYIIATQLAGHLRNNGVTFAEDTNVPCKKVITKIFSVQSDPGNDAPMLFSWKIQDRIEEVAQETGAYDFRVISVFRDHLDGQPQYTAFVQCQLRCEEEKT